MAHKPYVVVGQLNLATGTIDNEMGCNQIVIINPTALVIKVSPAIARTDAYDWIINAQKVFVSPVVEFLSLSYVIDAFASGLIRPSFYLYRRGHFTPGVSSLT